MRKIILFLILLISKTDIVFSQKITPHEFFNHVLKHMYHKDLMLVSNMTIYKKERVYKKQIKLYLSADQDQDSTLIEMLFPPKERGVKILTKGDYAWMYLPSTKKIIRLSGRTSFGGSDFLYDDIFEALRGLYRKYYEPVVVGEKDASLYLELNAKVDDKKPPYGKIIIFVEEISFKPQKIEFYTYSGKLLKILEYLEYKKVKGRIMPTKFIMRLAASTEYKTILELIDYSTEVIPQRIFTCEYLQKGL